MVAVVKNRGAWLLAHLGMAAIATLIASLVFNYAWRILVDRTANSPLFYVVTLVLGLAVYVIWRRDYLFIDRFEASPETFRVHTLLGVTKVFELASYGIVPSLHKTVSFPETKAGLSFSVVNRSTGRTVRSYTWTGFAREDFVAMSQLYGYRGVDDISQREL